MAFKLMTNKYFSDSPSHLLSKSLEETEKNVAFASVATALAKKLFPVPGGYRIVFSNN